MFKTTSWLLAIAFMAIFITRPLSASVAAEAKTLVAFRAEVDAKSAAAQDAQPTIVTTAWSVRPQRLARQDPFGTGAAGRAGA